MNEGITLSDRHVAHATRARAILRDLLGPLGATTSYAGRSPRRREKVPWRSLYGSQLAFVGDGVLDADGKHTGVKLVEKWSHEPGDIVTSSGSSHTGSPLKRYMVQPDRSLHAIC